MGRRRGYGRKGKEKTEERLRLGPGESQAKGNAAYFEGQAKTRARIARKAAQRRETKERRRNPNQVHLQRRRYNPISRSQTIARQPRSTVNLSNQQGCDWHQDRQRRTSSAPPCWIGNLAAVS